MKVWNKRERNVPSGAVYVGRPTKWGNPFSPLAGTLARWRVGSRDDAISRYRAWLLTQPALVAAARHELRGKDLVCWCAPKACHADILLELANEAGERTEE